MELLKYIIEDNIIAELLGRQNFTNKESAILELIKNAYDAKASYCRISFSKDKVEIKDDGEGMSSDEIKKYWMHIGVSSRGYTSDKGDRIYAGAKGIGRFALARLGDEVVILSKRAGEKSVEWKSDWSYSSLEESNVELSCGTTIQISKLRDRWNDNSIKKLIDYLSCAYRDTSMRIEIVDLKGECHVIEYIFSNPKLGYNYFSSTRFKFDSEKSILSVKIECDEFSEEIKKKFPNLPFDGKSLEIDMSAECRSPEWNKIIKHFDISEKINPSDLLSQVGSFEGVFFFHLKHVIKNEEESGVFKFVTLPEAYDAGVMLYRNAFVTAGYDGSSDWLGLNARSRKSPAAATHGTGYWRVRFNQFSGYVVIDKKENEHLRELSNRQGFEQDFHYSSFIFIITHVISEFERYRQDIIKAVLKTHDDSASALELMKGIATGRKKYEDFNDNQKKIFKGEIISALKQIDKLKTDIRNKKYDTQILNTLSTIGLMAASIAHELRNDRSAVETSCSLLKENLIETGCWEILTSPENMKFQSQNVPAIIDSLEKVCVKITRFLNVMLEDIERNKFLEDADLSITMDKLKNRWEYDYGNLNIEFEIVGDDVYRVSEDRLETIFNNLLLNTEQQNNLSSNISVRINLNQTEKKLKVVYSDDGIGLDSKYKDNPYRILEVNESTRPNGHGLGMWMVHNTIVETGGSIDEIKSTGPGFQIKFSLGDKLHE